MRAVAVLFSGLLGLLPLVGVTSSAQAAPHSDGWAGKDRPVQYSPAGHRDNWRHGRYYQRGDRWYGWNRHHYVPRYYSRPDYYVTPPQTYYYQVVPPPTYYVAPPTYYYQSGPPMYYHGNGGFNLGFNLNVD